VAREAFTTMDRVPSVRDQAYMCVTACGVTVVVTWMGRDRGITEIRRTDLVRRYTIVLIPWVAGGPLPW